MTVATPMNFPGWCRTTVIASSQVSGRSWTSSDPSGPPGVHDAQVAAAEYLSLHKLVVLNPALDLGEIEKPHIGASDTA
jgi:hypothetical protein